MQLSTADRERIHAYVRNIVERVPPWDRPYALLEYKALTRLLPSGGDRRAKRAEAARRRQSETSIKSRREQFRIRVYDDPDTAYLLNYSNRPSELPPPLGHFFMTGRAAVAKAFGVTRYKFDRELTRSGYLAIEVPVPGTTGAVLYTVVVCPISPQVSATIERYRDDWLHEKVAHIVAASRV